MAKEHEPPNEIEHIVCEHLTPEPHEYVFKEDDEWCTIGEMLANDPDWKDHYRVRCCQACDRDSLWTDPEAVKGNEAYNTGKVN